MFSLLRKKLGFREGEGIRAGLMFTYIFLVIASLLIVKPVRSSLFLTRFGAQQLPYAYVLVAIVSVLVALIYTRLTNRLALNRLITSSLIFFTCCLLSAWLLLNIDYHADWFIYVFYILVAIFGVISASQFWLLANYVFDAREAKRIFGFLGAGAISGGIFGGYLTNYLAPVFGTENLIFLCVVFLWINMLLLQVYLQLC